MKVTNEDIANTMNNYFVNVRKMFNLKKQISVGTGITNEFDNHVRTKILHEKCPEIVTKSFK